MLTLRYNVPVFILMLRGRVGSLRQPTLPQELFMILNPVRGWVDPWAIVRPEGFRKWRISMTSSGIEPATFRLTAQCLNHLLVKFAVDYMVKKVPVLCNTGFRYYVYVHIIRPFNLVPSHAILLQVIFSIRFSSYIGRSLFRFPMVPFEFFIDLILPVALWPLVRLNL